MSTITEACNCTEWTGGDALRRCDSHHFYHRGNKRLASVSSVIKSCWPIKPDFSKAPEEVLEKARERGILVDFLFSEYLEGRRLYIPAGTREDIIEEGKELFCRLRDWWQIKGRPSEVRSQVMLADDDVAGTCDLIAGQWIFDVKTVHSIEATYPLQLGAYADLYESQFGRAVEGIGIIHVTKRFATPQLIRLDVEECRKDWRTVRDLYALVKRRTA